MAEFIAIRDCLYSGHEGEPKRAFRVGDILPAHWTPNHHFMSQGDADLHIREEQAKAIGVVNPDEATRLRERLKQQYGFVAPVSYGPKRLKSELETRESAEARDGEETVKEIDFTALTEKDIEDLTATDIALEINRQFPDNKVSLRGHSKQRLIDMALELAMSKE